MPTDIGKCNFPEACLDFTKDNLRDIEVRGGSLILDGNCHSDMLMHVHTDTGLL